MPRADSARWARNKQSTRKHLQVIFSLRDTQNAPSSVGFLTKAGCFGPVTLRHMSAETSKVQISRKLRWKISPQSPLSKASNCEIHARSEDSSRYKVMMREECLVCPIAFCADQRMDNWSLIVVICDALPLRLATNGVMVSNEEFRRKCVCPAAYSKINYEGTSESEEARAKRQRKSHIGTQRSVKFGSPTPTTTNNVQEYFSGVRQYWAHSAWQRPTSTRYECDVQQ